MAANREPKLFDNILLEDGRKAHMCLVDDECRAQHVRYLRRGDMMDHLLKVHGIECDIPKRKGDVEYKFKRNVKAQKAREVKKAKKAWDALEEDGKIDAGSKENFLNLKVSQAMESYLRDSEERMANIRRTIVDGFDKHRRPCGKDSKKSEETHDSSNKGSADQHRYEHRVVSVFLVCCHLKNVQSLLNVHVLQKRLQTTDEQGPLLAPMKIHGKKAFLEGSPISSSTSPLPKFHFRVQRPSPHLASDSPLPSSSLPLMKEHKKLIVDVNPLLVDAISKEKASTRTMILFCMWLENTLSQVVLDSQTSYCVLPNCGQGSLVPFVLYNNTIKKITRLPWENHGLMYLNSMTSDDSEEYLPFVYRALELMASNCTAQSLKGFMVTPRHELEHGERPRVCLQPNAVDCGFYVMTYIKHLTEDAHGTQSKSFLTKTSNKTKCKR
ncbi:hypothetical protein GOP47_0021724 [Adiantum capillus-veneris]|uniref:Ubiquitin-like protease family profile domain-containing protein n=1 Tax=Adiantum capillus-veneris TaxID=13818 RepID=A0A9D4U8W3_ADICA|nr:hypothetical protein GOP47_0021724 [Adiantum capillus-veneris]